MRFKNKLIVPKNQLIELTKGSLTLGNLIVEPFAVSHDAADPIGINVFAGKDKATVVTDTGVISDSILHRMDDTTLLVLEANYDPHMLRFGPYQPFLKQRVASDEGHLSNEMAAQALLMMNRPDFIKLFWLTVLRIIITRSLLPKRLEKCLLMVVFALDLK